MGLTKKIKRIVAQRAHFCCEYCRSQEEYSSSSFSVDHIVPSVKSGEDDLENLCFACQACNNYKYTDTATTDLISGEETPLFHPRRHSWEEHFIWNEDNTELIGITPIGRATIFKLRLNRAGVKNLRRVLQRLGLHPPKMG